MTIADMTIAEMLEIYDPENADAARATGFHLNGLVEAEDGQFSSFFLKNEVIDVVTFNDAFNDEFDLGGVRRDLVKCFHAIKI